jgi:hypothetical protein
MATAAELRQIIRDELYSGRSKAAQDRVLGGIPAGAALARPVDGDAPRLADNGDTGLLAGLLRSIASKVGADVDEAAIAAAVLEGLGPQVGDAVKAAVDGLGVPAGVDVDALAAAVVANLGARLSPPAA